ncbi:MAG: carboxypeptidase regulatory-like domain-containing protein, partial [Caldilineaceae bacterium]|nr:carboxypeptidase regulatory-like domain-containing protein [Caldilineaceae bacterium]
VAGQSDRTWDAGLYQPAPEPAELGDYVWYDTNVNGIQDETGTGVPGVTVNLYGNGTCTGQAIGTQQTDANGFYLFTGLQPGTYCVEFEKPAGFNFSPQNQGADDTKDSDADTSTGRTTAITLVAGQSDRTWDAGLYQPAPEPAELGDYVWEDTNGNGIQDETGTGVPGVTVRLYADCTGQAIDSQQTDANGFYLFTGLQPGTYCVEFEKPAGYEITGQNQGSNDTKDSDADVLTGRTQPTTLTPGESDLTWDAGLYRPAALGDRVWVDLDFESQDVLSGDGMQNKDGQGNYMEKGVPTVTVELYANGDCTGDPLAVQQTDENGNYLFTGLKPGQYCVVFRLPQGVLGIWTTPNIGPGDSDSDAITPDDALDTARKTISISLESGETDLTWDAGLIRLSGLGSSAVGDRVWLDNNKNGIQDDGEPDFTLPLTVQLLTPGDDTPLQTITTQGGFYLFDGLDSGIYCVQFQIPTGYVVTNPNQGGSGNVDSDVDPTGRTICFQLPDLTTDLTWDMGLYTTPTDLPVSEEPAATDVRIFLPTVIRQ